MKKYLILLPAAAVIVAGCANKEEIDTLQRELIEVKQEVAQLKEKQSKIESDISNLSRRVDDVSKVASQNAIEIQKMKTFEKPAGAPVENLPPEGEEKVKLPQNPEELYKYGLDSYYKGKIKEAQEAFQEFVKKYKDSELYDNALFWVGQTYYVEGKYEEAIKKFDELIKGCETGEIKDCNKLPAAMLKKGFSLEKLGEIDKAIKLYQEIIQKFPDTEEAELARKKLEVIQ